MKTLLLSLLVVTNQTDTLTVERNIIVNTTNIVLFTNKKQETFYKGEEGFFVQPKDTVLYNRNDKQYEIKFYRKDE